MNAALTTEYDAGILTLAFDHPKHAMNVLSSAVIEEFAAAIDAAIADSRVTGILLCSRKQTFVVGADLKELLATIQREPTAAAGFRLSQRLTGVLRRMETCGKPVAAAINGSALGGGLEICLACHYRVLAADCTAVIGLPEVTLGLLPAAGGTQRLPRLIGVAAALPLLTKGTPLSSSQALELGVVHALAPAADVVQCARRWLLGTPTARQPWDEKGYLLPKGGVMAPAVATAFMISTAQTAKSNHHNYPAPLAILSAVFEGCNVPIEAGLKIESQYFALLQEGPVPRNMIRTLFVGKGAAGRRAQSFNSATAPAVQRLGIVGGGMMGIGIAYAAARATLPVVLLDQSQALAERAREKVGLLLKRDVQKGSLKPDAAAATLELIVPTTEYTDLTECDLVIEAVFEQRELKAEVIRRCEAVVSAAATLATNTSTLPISSLGQNSLRPDQFIGMHFFSPVDKMPLVEIIRGRQTSAVTIARALDFVATLRKVPIVVNDGRGFYTTRVFATYTAEGMRLLEEGVQPALIENAALAAGMPVGPLAVSDEVTLELQYDTMQESERDLGAAYRAPVNRDVLKTMVIDLKRIGRRAGHGFYEHPADEPKFLWPGLATLFPPSLQQPSLEEVGRRLLHIQALESARCLEEAIITSAVDGDIGSVLGIGFPSYTGGTLSYIDMLGVRRFAAECAELARRHGARFAPSQWLLERAARNVPFHPLLEVTA